jgi:signal transduction histidine kinase/ActR/RegA family two-component response regulator
VVLPLRRRLIVLTAAAILPLALLAAAGLYVLSRQQEEQTRRVGIELARSVANAVNTELRGSITILETLATSPTLDRDDLAAFGERARRIVAVQHSWAALVLTDSAGVPTLDTRIAPGAPPLPVSDQNSVDEVIRTRQPVVGRLVAQGDDMLFPVRVPVLREGQLRHVLSALVKPAAIRDVITRQQIPDDWVISIVDREGLRVARSRAHVENLGGRLSPTAERVVAAGGEEGIGISTSLEGDEIYTPYSNVPPFGWRAVLGIPTATARAAAWRSRMVLGGGVLLSIILGTLGAGWVARGITAPIAQLRAAADALGRRQMPAVPHTSLGEVRDVAIAMTNAAAEIARYEREREALLVNERKARESAERADRAKDEFLAVLSHELRTPLNAVSGWARLLQHDHLTDPAQIARAKDAIVRNADAQVRLIDDLLDLSRLARGKVHLSLGPVRMADVRQAAVDAIRPSASEKGISIAVADAGDHDDIIVGDAARLQQVIWNLLANAVKFTGSGGEIVLTQRSTVDGIEIAVRDTGEGMAPEILPYVFDRFRQGDGSSTRSHRGLGLGLALVKDLVTLHGGTVSAFSEGPGRGSTVTVNLPRIAETPAAMASPAPPALADDGLQTIVRLDGLRIVVVDDDADARMLSGTILRNAGAQVRTCSSVAEALVSIDEIHPHVVVSDLEMPGADGFALIQQLRMRSRPDGGLTPAIALSAYGRPEERARALGSGFNMHVPKPVDPGELTLIIAGVSGRADVGGGQAGYGKMPISM